MFCRLCEVFGIYVDQCIPSGYDEADDSVDTSYLCVICVYMCILCEWFVCRDIDV